MRVQVSKVSEDPSPPTPARADRLPGQGLAALLQRRRGDRRRARVQLELQGRRYPRRRGSGGNHRHRGFFARARRLFTENITEASALPK